MQLFISIENFTRSMPIILRVFIFKLFTTLTFCFSSIILLDGVLVQRLDLNQQ